jgi:hypothetical protein
MSDDAPQRFEVRLWNALETLPAPAPARGRWARPAETPCLACGRTDRWQEDEAPRALWPDGDRYWCACGDGQIRYEPWLGWSGSGRPWVQTGGRAWQAAHDAWLRRHPPEYEPPAPTVALTCGCGAPLTATPVAFEDDDGITHAVTCACGIRVALDVPPTRRPTYDAERAAWQAEEPPWRHECLRWIAEEGDADGRPPRRPGLALAPSDG